MTLSTRCAGILQKAACLPWLLLALGCAKHDHPSPPATPADGRVTHGRPIEPTTKPSRSGGVFSARDEAKNRLLLKEIGLACLTEDVGKLPKTIEELKAILKGSKGLAPVESGEFVLAANAEVSGNSLFLYERDPDSRGDRLVLMGDGSVHKKSAEEFAALKK